MTRALKAALFSSIDGVVDEPHNFQFDAFDERMGQLMGEAIGPVTDVIMGRVTYTQWADYWPAATDPFGQFINPVRKHVASRTLTADQIQWHNASLIDGDLHEFVTALKATEGGDISVTGSISVVRDLFLAGLLDELTLMIHPVIAGEGRRLFEPGTPLTRLRLVGEESTPAGNVIARYALR